MGKIVEKIWLKHYPKGVPAEIDINEYASVREIFEASVGKYGSQPAFSCMGKTLTFAELRCACSARCAPGAPWSTSTRCTRRANSSIS